MSQVFVIGHKSPDTDSIAAAISYAYLKRQLGMDAVAKRAGEPNKETKYALDYFGVEAPEYVEQVAADQPVILVDHNESKQRADGIESAQILEVVDHHRLGDLETPGPIFMLFRPVGCVNTVIYGLYKLHGIVPEKSVAGMMLSAIIPIRFFSVLPRRRKKTRKPLRNWQRSPVWIMKPTAWIC